MLAIFVLGFIVGMLVGVPFGGRRAILRLARAEYASLRRRAGMR